MINRDLIIHYPKLFHMAEAGTYQSIINHGLLSTSALLDLFDISGETRSQIESCHRPECITVEHDILGTAVIRDQKPMSDGGLIRCLQDGLGPRDWYELLNGKVFFWATFARLLKLINAKAYRNKAHLVLEIDTSSLLENHENQITLSPYNSGSTKPNPFPRGRNIFLPISKYPFDYWRSKRGRSDAVVEVVVDYSVPDVRDFIISAYHMKGDQVIEKIC
jgi:hypothetical protein